MRADEKRLALVVQRKCIKVRAVFLLFAFNNTILSYVDETVKTIVVNVKSVQMFC